MVEPKNTSLAVDNTKNPNSPEKAKTVPIAATTDIDKSTDAVV